MLMARHAVLRDLIDRYQAIAALDSADRTERRFVSAWTTSPTRCMSTGTRDIDAALIAARHQLPGARLLDDSALHAG